MIIAQFLVAVVLGLILMALVVIVGQWVEDRKRELILGRLLIDQQVLIREQQTVNGLLGVGVEASSGEVPDVVPGGETVRRVES